MIPNKSESGACQLLWKDSKRSWQRRSARIRQIRPLNLESRKREGLKNRFVQRSPQFVPQNVYTSGTHTHIHHTPQREYTMPPPLAGIVTSLAAALCYGMCVSDANIRRTQTAEEAEEPMDLTGIDIRQDGGLSTISMSSVGASTVLHEAAQDGFFGNNCFLELSMASRDALDVSSDVGAKRRK